MEFKEKVYNLLVCLGRFMADAESGSMSIIKDDDGVLKLQYFISDKEVKETTSEIEKIVRHAFNEVMKVALEGILDLTETESMAVDSGLYKK